MALISKLYVGAGIAMFMLCSTPPAAAQALARDDHFAVFKARNTPIIEAIYTFKSNHGLWPCSLAELVPGLLKSQTIRGADYCWQTNSWTLCGYEAFPRYILRYEMRGRGEAGWVIDDGVEPKRIRNGAFALSQSAVSDAEMARRRIAVLESRIHRYPNELVHHAGLVCLYFRRGCYRDARERCLQCAKRWPMHWWPHLMLGHIDIKLGLHDKAEQQFGMFTSPHDDLPHWYLIGQCYAAAGEMSKARRALARAARSPLPDDTRFSPLNDPRLMRGGAGFAWEAAALCYNNSWFAESLAICAAWERLRMQRGYGDQSYWSLRAACYLAQNKLPEARVAIDKMLVIAKQRSVWAANVNELKAAIQKHDSRYRYDPGVSDTFSVFIDYE